MVGKRQLSLALLTAVIALTPSASALAATAATPAAPAPSPNGAQGLEISPPVMELSADPGQAVVANIRVRNVTSGTLVVTGKADDFGAKGEEGAPEILFDEKEASRYSLKFWIPSVPTLRLLPGEAKTTAVQIRVPANAEPGGHYGVVRFTGTPAQLEGSGVSLTASIGTLVLLRVSGNITEKLTVAEFYSGTKDKKSSFFQSGPVTLTERIKNEGSVHMKPVGYVNVYNTFGKQVNHVPVSNPARNILPDSIRKFTQTIENRHMFGRYTAKFNVAYGEKKTLQSKTVAFWVIPYKLILLVIILIVIGFFILRSALRRYKRHIIAQSRRHNKR